MTTPDYEHTCLIQEHRSFVSEGRYSIFYILWHEIWYSAPDRPSFYVWNGFLSTFGSVLQRRKTKSAKFSGLIRNRNTQQNLLKFFITCYCNKRENTAWSCCLLDNFHSRSRVRNWSQAPRELFPDINKTFAWYVSFPTPRKPVTCNGVNTSLAKQFSNSPWIQGRSKRAKLRVIWSESLNNNNNVWNTFPIPWVIPKKLGVVLNCLWCLIFTISLLSLFNKC